MAKTSDKAIAVQAIFSTIGTVKTFAKVTVPLPPFYTITTAAISVKAIAVQAQFYTTQTPFYQPLF
jgi:hypothetical protein